MVSCVWNHTAQLSELGTCMQDIPSFPEQYVNLFQSSKALILRAFSCKTGNISNSIETNQKTERSYYFFLCHQGCLILWGQWAVGLQTSHYSVNTHSISCCADCWRGWPEKIQSLLPSFRLVQRTVRCLSPPPSDSPAVGPLVHCLPSGP